MASCRPLTVVTKAEHAAARLSFTPDLDQFHQLQNSTTEQWQQQLWSAAAAAEKDDRNREHHLRRFSHIIYHEIGEVQHRPGSHY
ncbi:hypothetical protein V2J09_008671 [Rumex salicifolius]